MSSAEPKPNCSFCHRKATRLVSDEGGFYDCCATCERAWKVNPSFITDAEREELKRKGFRP